MRKFYRFTLAIAAVFAVSISFSHFAFAQANTIYGGPLKANQLLANPVPNGDNLRENQSHLKTWITKWYGPNGNYENSGGFSSSAPRDLIAEGTNNRLTQTELSTIEGLKLTQTVDSQWNAANGGSREWTVFGVNPADSNNMTRGGPADNIDTYGILVVHAPTDMKAVMSPAHDDHAQIWVNGEKWYNNSRWTGSAQTILHNVEVELQKGANVVLYRVGTSGGSGYMNLHFDDRTHEVCKIYPDRAHDKASFFAEIANILSLEPISPSTYTVTNTGTETAEDASLMLYLSFDELNGNQAIDHSRYGNHGRLVGNPRLVQGKFGNALEFNGQSDWVEIPHDESLTVNRNVTVMAWVYALRHQGPGGAAWQGILAKGNYPRSYSLYTEYNGSIHLSVNNFYGSVSTEKVNLNEWQHVVAQVDSGAHRYWINGRDAGGLRYTRDNNVAPSLPGKADTFPVLIGNTHESGRQFLGLIDEVRIYNRALSEAEIIEQMKKGFDPTDVASDSPPTGTVPGSPASIVVSVSPSQVQSPALGERLVLNMNITGGENVAGYQLTLHFDTTALRYVSSSNADYLPAGAFVVPPKVSGNQVTLAATSLSGGSEGDGTLATVTFEVVAVKSSSLTLSEVKLTDVDADFLLVSSENGKVVESGSLTEAAGTVVSLTPSPVESPAVGETLTFSVSVAGGKNVAGYALKLAFDATALRYVSSNNADYLPTGAFVVPAVVNDNQVALAATSLSGGSQGDGTLATVTFEVVAVKPSTLRLSEVSLTDSDAKTLTVRTKNGEVVEVVGLPGDVNEDGVVDVNDMNIAASRIGQTGENTADMNGNGVVDAADLLLIAAAIEAAAAAPALYSPDIVDMFTATEVRQWLKFARAQGLTGPMYQRGIQFLEQLLMILTPKETALLVNYPNPFNPETWIPYHLSKSADVTVRIYAADGRLIRTLAFGHQGAGIYESRSRAVYWDGKNEVGEPVASGVYFYTLTAGDFAATRKMLIRK